MTDISTPRTTAAGKKSWRVVDIVLAALIAIAGGVIFWAWDQGSNVVSVPLTAVYPPLTGLYAGGWMIPAVLGMLVVRKPGAALFCEAVAATGELIMGSQYGTTVLISGILQGLGAELVFAAFRYSKFNLPVSLLAGAGAGLFCGLNDCFLLNLGLSSRVIAGGLAWIATRGLARTGVLASFASRKAATEPVFS